jgi:hypothetical protein
MQATEITGDGVDGDSDGVVDELTVGDITALSVYMAAQPRPTTLLELNEHGLIDPLPQDQIDSINRGATKFAQIGCGNCHVSTLTLNSPIFAEPSQDPNYRDPNAPSHGPVSAMEEIASFHDQVDFAVVHDPFTPNVQQFPRDLDPALAVTFDLTQDQPDNQIEDDQGNVIFRLGSLRTNSSGQAVVELYGDLKRHYMGSGLAEGIDEVGTGAATFLTENLWGVASTAPYLHDGRATTLTEAILEHRGDSSGSRSNFLNLSTNSKKDVIAFLNNLVLFKIPEE